MQASHYKFRHCDRRHSFHQRAQLKFGAREPTAVVGKYPALHPRLGGVRNHRFDYVNTPAGSEHAPCLLNHGGCRIRIHMVKCRNTKRKIDRGVANVQFTSIQDFKYRAVSPACQFNTRRRDVDSEIILLPKQFAVRPNTATDIQDLRTGWCTQMPADKILIYRCGRSA